MEETEEEGIPVLMNYLKKRIENNKNWLNVTTGSPGSGKSYADLRLAELWYKYYFNEEFPIKNCCFSIETLMRRFIESEEGELRKGELLILEEAGTLINAKDFQNRINKLFNFYMQSFRCRNLLLIFNLPLMSMLDKSTRLLVHSHFVTSKIIKTKKICQIKPFFTQINQDTGKVYRKYLRVSEIEGKYYYKKPVKLMTFKLPSKKLRQQYEIKKELFVKELAEKILFTITTGEKKPLTERQEKILEVMTKQPYKTLSEYAKIVGLEPGHFSMNLGFMERKGYNMRKFLRKSGFRGFK